MGYKIGYEEAAIAWTEAPDRLRTLARQRFRWAYGTLSVCGSIWMPCSSTLRRARLHCLAERLDLPDTIPAHLAGIGPDARLYFDLGGLDRLAATNRLFFHNLSKCFSTTHVFGYCWISACFAFALEKKERWRLLWWLF